MDVSETSGHQFTSSVFALFLLVLLLFLLRLLLVVVAEASTLALDAEWAGHGFANWLRKSERVKTLLQSVSCCLFCLSLAGATPSPFHAMPP